ncbi:hypothetical protein V8E51_014898 [Hyaloscypha variabilis]
MGWRTHKGSWAKMESLWSMAGRTLAEVIRKEIPIYPVCKDMQSKGMANPNNKCSGLFQPRSFFELEVLDSKDRPGVWSLVRGTDSALMFCNAIKTVLDAVMSNFHLSAFLHPKKSLPYINGPCIMQAKSDQIGSSDTPDWDDGRRPVAKLDKWVSYQRDARAQFGWTPKSTMASLALQRGCQPCGYPRKNHIQGSPTCLHKPWPIALPPHFPRFHENEAIELNSPKPPAFNILNQSVCYSIYSVNQH